MLLAPWILETSCFQTTSDGAANVGDVQYSSQLGTLLCSCCLDVEAEHCRCGKMPREKREANASSEFVRLVLCNICEWRAPQSFGCTPSSCRAAVAVQDGPRWSCSCIAGDMSYPQEEKVRPSAFPRRPMQTIESTRGHRRSEDQGYYRRVLAENVRGI